MRAILVPLLVVLCLAQPVLAQDQSGKVGAPGTNVEMPFLIAPMSKDGKLLGYAYISSKLVASSQTAAIAVREKLAFIQDAFVRDVNAQPIGKSDDPTQADTALLNDRLVGDARSIVGADKVVSIAFVAIQFAPLHPGESTLNKVPPSERAPDAQPPANQSAGQASAPAAGAALPATSQPAKDATH